MNNGNISYRSIAVLLFTVLLSSCLKETAVPIESAFLVESSEDKNLSSDDSTKAFKIVGDEGKSYFR